MYENLMSLVDKWEGVSRRKFLSAKRQKDNVLDRPTGQRFTEHGAMCYLNCAQELRELIISLLPLSQATQKGDQK